MRPHAARFEKPAASSPMLLPPEARGNVVDRGDPHGATKLRRFLPCTKMNAVVPI